MDFEKALKQSYNIEEVGANFIKCKEIEIDADDSLYDGPLPYDAALGLDTGDDYLQMIRSNGTWYNQDTEKPYTNKKDIACINAIYRMAVEVLYGRWES